MCSDFRNTESGRQRDWRLPHWILGTKPNKRAANTQNSPRQLLTLHEGTILFSPNNPVIFDLILTIEPFFFYMYTTRTFSLLPVAKTTTEIAVRAQFYLVFLYAGHIKHIHTCSILALEFIWNVKSSIHSGVWQKKALQIQAKATLRKDFPLTPVNSQSSFYFWKVPLWMQFFYPHLVSIHI